MITSKRAQNSHDINFRACLAMAELGMGRESMASICCMIGMPAPSSQSNWDLHNKKLLTGLQQAVEEQYQNAAEKLRNCLHEEDSTSNDDDVIDVVVSYDGTWHHRGFKSSHGIGIVMSIDTGEILDAEVVSKTCEICQRCKYDKNSTEFEQWQEEHISKGECQCNFDGPSTNMETAAAKAIWSRSVIKHKMRYVSILCDGDNKTIQALNESQVYGSDVEITKLDCVNHVHKRMGTGLRNLVKKSPHVKGGSGGLTAGMITKLSSYYRKHIMDHTTSSKDPNDINNAVKKMQINILASLHHSVANKNPNEQHKFCFDENVNWCTYKKDLQNPQSNSNTKQKEKNKLPESFLQPMLPLYTRLSDESLLKRCVGGLTQNQNEGFNSTLWKRCPKERYFGTKAVKRALALSVISWNMGRQGFLTVFRHLNIDTNVFTKQALLSKDKRRLSFAERFSNQLVKRRKLAKPSNSGDYVPGGH